MLQLLGGFSKVHQLENVQRSLNNHYTSNDSRFEEIKKFEKKIKNKIDFNSDYLMSSIRDLCNNTSDHLYLSKIIISEINKIIFDQQLDQVGVPFCDSDFDFTTEEISKLNEINYKRKETFLFTQSDEINLKQSSNEFENNYKFNVLLSYILSLESIIKILLFRIKKIKTQNYVNKLENILLVVILNYFNIISEFNSVVNKELQIEIPSNFPNPFSSNTSLCYCDHTNEKTNSFKLLFSGYEVNYNLYSLTELKTFCINNCKTYKSQNNSTTSLNSYFYFNNSKRNYSSLSMNQVGINRNLLKNMQNRNIENQESTKLSKNKAINYRKSIFSILEKIRELTESKGYDPKKVQLKIKNYWFEILKEKYPENIYNSIRDNQPKIYEIFVTKNPN
jgi:hypothetical protein